MRDDSLALVRAVVFDVGETLVDESGYFGAWAGWLGVPRHTFSAVFGAVISAGRDHRDVFAHFRPGFDLEHEQHLRRAAGRSRDIGADDLYPDARPALTALSERGYRIGIAGNQPARAGRILRDMRLPASFIAMSAEWAVSKPDPGFFARVGAAAGVPAAQILYVGDRLDNDIVPAHEAGFVTAFIRRGPWGHLHADWPDISRADLVLAGLDELAGLLPGPGSGPDSAQPAAGSPRI